MITPHPQRIEHICTMLSARSRSRTSVPEWVRRGRVSHSTPFVDSIGCPIPLSALRRMDLELSCRFTPGHSRFTNQVQPFSLRSPSDPRICGIEQSHTYAAIDRKRNRGTRKGERAVQSATLCPQGYRQIQQVIVKEGQNESLTSKALTMEFHWK